MIEKAKPMAAAMMEAAAADIEFKDGSSAIVGTDRRSRSSRSHKASYAPMGLTDKFGVGLEAVGSYSADAAELSRTAAMSARSRSIPKPAKSRSMRYFVVDDVGACSTR